MKELKMKNKTKAWRKISKTLNGEGKLVRIARHYRNFMARQKETKAYPSYLIIGLLKHATIATPVFDKAFDEARQKWIEQMGKQNESVTENLTPLDTNDNIIDVEPILTGA